MTRYLPVLIAALMLAASCASDQDRLSGSPADEGTAAVNDAEALPAEVPLADVVDPLAPAPASGPSFDCGGGWRDAERHICDDPEIADIMGRSRQQLLDERAEPGNI